jgi:catechol 2,3-dioxygenase-like lactoylglutathione lyase family enzyme
MPELDAIGLVVADMAASLAFYRRLGLEIPAEAEQEDHVEASLKGGIRLMFDKQELIRGLDPSGRLLRAALWSGSSSGSRAQPWSMPSTRT